MMGMRVELIAEVHVESVWRLKGERDGSGGDVR